MGKSEREERINIEQRARCSNEVYMFSRVCALESAINNDCATCPFKPFKDSINIILIENVRPVYPTLELVGPPVPLLALTNNWTRQLPYFVLK